MPLLITTNPTAQMQIMNGICCVLTTHSENSRNVFALRLEQLASDTARDVIITSCTVDRQNLEFGLSWFDGKPGQHPQLSGFRPVGDGELVFYPFNDVWSIHQQTTEVV